MVCWWQSNTYTPLYLIETVRATYVPIRSLLARRGGSSPPLAPYIALPPTTRRSNIGGYSDPEGNFEGNQLLGRSMSLSPLYVTLTNDLHVSTGTALHHGFPWLKHGNA
jgi:hypothetical protein